MSTQLYSDREHDSENSSRTWLYSELKLWLKRAGMVLGYLLIISVASYPAGGQELSDATAEVSRSNSAPHVYLDCGACDFSHVRQEIRFVQYVRDPELADIHVFVTHEPTGTGGRRHTLSFIGQNQFREFSYDLEYVSGRDDTWAERRDGLTRKLEIGFVPYVARTALGGQLAVSFEGEVDDNAVAPDDPWNFWTFRIYGGSFRLRLESSRNRFDSRWGFSADRVTEDWKLRFRPFFNFDTDHIRRTNGDVRSRRHRNGIDSYAIRSVTAHWSAGLFSDYLTRTDQNLKNRFRVSPGIEYSVYPYELASRKAITFVYRLGYSAFDYYEETIFDQKSEGLLVHQFDANVGIRQPWGNIHAGATASNYLHNFEHRRAEFYTSVSFRLTEGLSLNFSAQFEVVRDQLYLPRGDASLEEILLQQRQQATDYYVSTSVALSYTFGSRFTGVVNPRF